MWSELALCGVVVFADHACDDAFSVDGSQVRHVPDGLRFDVRGPLVPGLVRPVMVVVAQVLAEHLSQVAFAEDQDRSSSSRRRVPITRSQMAFIRGFAAKW
jgi:hypothetical protein